MSVNYSNSIYLRAEFILKKLQATFPNPPIPLNHTNPYTLLVAAVLATRCTDAQVNKVTSKLFTLADNPEMMLQLNSDEIYSVIKTCSFAPAKSKALWELSRQLVKKHQGKVPRSFEALEQLPGVGHKTASVVMSLAFDIPAFPVDTHIHRLAQNWKLTTGRNVEQTENDLKKLFQQKYWNQLHLQFIYWGRQFCGAKTCRGLVCEICKTLYPKRKKPIILKT